MFWVILLFFVLYVAIIFFLIPSLPIPVWLCIALLFAFIVFDYFYSKNIYQAPSSCFKTGCSGQLCSDIPITTTCDAKCTDYCFRNAQCKRINGACSFAINSDLQSCIDKCNSM